MAQDDRLTVKISLVAMDSDGVVTFANETTLGKMKLIDTVKVEKAMSNMGMALLEEQLMFLQSENPNPL